MEGLNLLCPPRGRVGVREIGKGNIARPHHAHCRRHSVNLCHPHVHGGTAIIGRVRPRWLYVADSRVHNHDIMLPVLVQVPHHVRHIGVTLGVQREVQVLVHVINVIPLRVLGNVCLSHGLHNLQSVVGAVVPPSTQVETECPVRWKEGTANQLKRRAKNRANERVM
jgi:hypothetical protein